MNGRSTATQAVSKAPRKPGHGLPMGACRGEKPSPTTTVPTTTVGTKPCPEVLAKTRKMEGRYFSSASSPRTDPRPSAHVLGQKTLLLVEGRKIPLGQVLRSTSPSSNSMRGTLGRAKGGRVPNLRGTLRQGIRPILAYSGFIENDSKQGEEFYFWV